MFGSVDTHTHTHTHTHTQRMSHTWPDWFAEFFKMLIHYLFVLRFFQILFAAKSEQEEAVTIVDLEYDTISILYDTTTPSPAPHLHQHHTFTFTNTTPSPAPHLHQYHSFTNTTPSPTPHHNNTRPQQCHTFTTHLSPLRCVGF